jgi:3-hydroxyacyl-[acyl-carrier-protein] dehydratase
MLINDLYTVVSKQSEDGKVVARISFDKAHRIFNGHFPGHPVVPGVCMMQIVREIMELDQTKRLKIAVGNNMKFMNIIDPEKNAQVDVAVTYTLEGNDYKVNATLTDASVTFFKFKGVLQIISR